MTLSINDIKQDTRARSEVMIDDLFWVILPPCRFTPTHMKLLVKWNFRELQTELDFVSTKVTAEPKDAKKTVELNKTEDVDLSDFSEDAGSKSDARIVPEKFKTTESVDISEFTESSSSGKNGSVSDSLKNTTKQAHTSLASYIESKKPSIDIKAAISKKPVNEEITLAEENARIADSRKVYESFMEYINQIYTKYATQKTFNIPELNGKVLELVNYIRENKKYILRISPSYEIRNKNYIISHSMRTTVLSIVIGLQLRMPSDKIVELGVTSILHEIGQIRLPPQLYMSSRPLNNSERAQLMTHTIIGYNIIKEAGFPLTVQLGVLEHHERETGAGYPRCLTGDKISLYAKIIGIACSFEAITAPREFKSAKTTYEGMVELLRNEKSLYDDVIVKSLLYSLSLYPIGAYVFLSNGKVGQVVDVRPDNPKNPIIQIVGSVNPDGTPKKVLTNDTNLKIMRVMTEQETKDLKASIGGK